MEPPWEEKHRAGIGFQISFREIEVNGNVKEEWNGEVLSSNWMTEQGSSIRKGKVRREVVKAMKVVVYISARAPNLIYGSESWTKQYESVLSPGNEILEKNEELDKTRFDPK